jgi:epoxyqueuosine reductase
MNSPQAKAIALELGFNVCRVTTAEPSGWSGFFREWIEEGRAGEMAWLGKHLERRTSLEAVLPGAQSLIVVGLNYWQPELPQQGRIARYAWGLDYHEVMLPKLQSLADRLSRDGAISRIYVDTGPVLEKPLAERSGLGWQGKSTMLLSTRFGPWLLLGEIITTLKLEPDAPGQDHCGKCSRCLDLCPTGAITAPYQLDARRCIAYLTIELKGSIPVEMRPLIGDHIYGCDVCLEVCPWNRFAQTTQEARFAPIPGVKLSLTELLALTSAEFKVQFAGSPILRIKRRGLLRNVCVAFGNIGTAADLSALEKAALDSEPLVVEHARWAIEQIRARITPPQDIITQLS